MTTVARGSHLCKCFDVQQILSWLPVMRLHSCANLHDAANTRSTPYFPATFLKLCETLCTYGTTANKHLFCGVPTTFTDGSLLSCLSRVSATAWRSRCWKPACCNALAAGNFFTKTFTVDSNACPVRLASLCPVFRASPHSNMHHQRVQNSTLLTTIAILEVNKWKIHNYVISKRP